MPTEQTPESSDLTPTASALPRRMTPLTIGLIVTAGVLVLAVGSTLIALVVSGMARSPSATPTAQEPSSSPSSSASAEPDDPEPVAAPQPVLPIGCSELLPTSVLAGVLAQTPKLVEESDRDPASLNDASDLEVGMVHCMWTISKGTTLSNASVTLLPRAADDYADYREWVVPSPYEPVDTAGDRSDLYCWVNNVEGLHVWSCHGNLLVDDYWLGVSLSDTRKSQVAEEVARARMNEVLESLSSTIRSAGAAGPEWQAPPGQFGGVGLCDDVPAILADAFDRNFTPISPEGDGPPIDYAAQDKSGIVWCTQESKDRYATVGALPGGAWAFADRPPSSDYSAVEIDGSNYAWVSCGSDHCIGIAERHGDLVELRWGTSSREKFTTAFARVIEGIDGA